MTTTNMCSDFDGFRWGPLPDIIYINVYRLRRRERRGGRSGGSLLEINMVKVNMEIAGGLNGDGC